MAKKKYSPEEIERILQENKELRVYKQREEERRKRQKESGAYKKQYERMKKRMQEDPEYAELVKKQRKSYQEKRRRKLQKIIEEHKRYVELYGPLS